MVRIWVQFSFTSVNNKKWKIITFLRKVKMNDIEFCAFIIDRPMRFYSQTLNYNFSWLNLKWIDPQTISMTIKNKEFEHFFSFFLQFFLGFFFVSSSLVDMLNSFVFAGLWSIKRKSTERTTPGAGRPGSRWRSPLFQEGFWDRSARIKLKTEKTSQGRSQRLIHSVTHDWTVGAVSGYHLPPRCFFVICHLRHSQLLYYYYYYYSPLLDLLYFCDKSVIFPLKLFFAVLLLLIKRFKGLWLCNPMFSPQGGSKAIVRIQWATTEQRNTFPSPYYIPIIVYTQTGEN